ncbi:MAG: DUF348 domain-containing protein [Ruminococcaceae bacterium]|nr:DUF348 domain-containing protein [Oscillospiraceae bacterium]
MKSRCIFTLILTVMFIVSAIGSFAAPYEGNVTIVDGNETFTVYTDSVVVKDIISEQGIEIGKSDVIYPALNSEINEDNTIVIKRLKLLDVFYDGQHLSYWTDAATYGEFILKGTTGADEDDIFDVDMNANLEPNGNTLNITKVDHMSYQETENIPHTSKVVYDDTIELGKRSVTVAGVDGKRVKTYDIEYHDGVEVARVLTNEEVAVEPVGEVITEGTKPPSITVNGRTVTYKKVLNCKATAYDLSIESCGKAPGTPGYGITASGTTAKYGTVAVDPRVIPLGTKMYIVSADGKFVYGFCTAEDTGGAIKGNKVDLFYNTRSECLQFGRRDVLVYIL